tara:strand:+ start:338 stop:1294 length:957 start_codon:yes stop_codon:yes gene_type:complete
MNYRNPLNIFMLFLTSNLNCDEISLDVVKDDWYETEIIIFSDGNPNTTSSSDELESIELTQQRTFDRDIFFTLTHDNNIIRDLNPSIVKDLFWFRNKNIDRSLTSWPKWASEGEKPLQNEGQYRNIELDVSPVDDNNGLVPIIEIGPQPSQKYPTKLNTDISIWLSELYSRSFIWETNELSLSKEARQLRRNGFNIIQHGKWTQRVPSRETPQKALIQLGHQAGNQFPVEGYLSLTKARYLHFEAKLWLSIINDELSPTSNDKPPYALLNESRRMRSNELHYLDHPLFGLLVRIKPLPIPKRITELAAVLDDFSNDLQ